MLVSGLTFVAKTLGFFMASVCVLAVFLIVVGRRVLRRLLHPRA